MKIMLIASHKLKQMIELNISFSNSFIFMSSKIKVKLMLSRFGHVII